MVSSSGLLTRRILHREYNYYVLQLHHTKNRCEWCGVHNYSLREDTGAGVVLTAAHVYDKRPEACGLLNLAGGGTLPAVSPPPRR